MISDQVFFTEYNIPDKTRPMEQWAIMGELRFRLKKVFDEEGIEIPWPHTKIFFGNTLPEGSIAEIPAIKAQDEITGDKKKKGKKKKRTPEMPVVEYSD